MCPPRPTIYDIKHHVIASDPDARHFFDRAALKAFGQRLSDFGIYKQEDGRYLIKAPRYFVTPAKKVFIGYTERYYNPANGKLTIS
jgi:hypothetical protein